MQHSTLFATEAVYAGRGGDPTGPDAEESPMTTPIDPQTRIGHVHLRVADLDRALGFYCGVLGFTAQAHYSCSSIGLRQLLRTARAAPTDRDACARYPAFRLSAGGLGGRPRRVGLGSSPSLESPLLWNEE